MIYLLIYAAGWLLCVRPAARRALVFLEDEWDEGDEPTTFDRYFALLIGACLALLWPIVLLALASRPSRWLRAPTEIERAKDDELERLRALAREHNLPMGDER